MGTPRTQRGVAELTAAKAAGEQLDVAEIAGFVNGYHQGVISDAQAAAFATAVYIRGLTRPELAALCTAMVASGETLRWDTDRPIVDKHSTGGVGDKISLVLAPLLAAAGYAVPMLSGRGLGHTGGTLDKLEAIPGYQATPSPEQLAAILEQAGCFIAGAGSRIAPADAKLYALRDHTGTVASVDLIAASIISKKIAGGADTLVVDVRWGSGAFCDTVDDATALSHRMGELAADAGIAFSCAISQHDTPLGNTCGNACEVRETLDVLAGAGPTVIRDHTIALCVEIAALAGGDTTAAQFAKLIDNGAAATAFETMVAAHGGRLDELPDRGAHRQHVTATQTGWVNLDALDVGRAAWSAGAGRTAPGAAVDTSAGIILDTPSGTHVEAGQRICTVEGADAAKVAAAAAALQSAVTCTAEQPQPDAGAGNPRWWRTETRDHR